VSEGTEVSGAEPGYERHLFVCMNERRPGHPRGCCAERGGAEVRARLKALTAEHGMKGRVRVNQAGCLDYCEHGAVIVVYPEGVWYGAVTVEDVDAIFQEHILRGEPVERLRLELTVS
jgi:(2Fe-2S) ferredoxin